MRTLCLLLALFVSHSLVLATNTDPFSDIPADRREALSKRITGYVEAYRARNWEKLYGFVSDVGRGGVSQKMFIAAMQASHGKNFAQDPDLQEFKPDRTKTNADGFDIYRCGRAEREGQTYKGIAVVHGVFEHDDWYFTGWSFTEFPNESCKALSGPKWEPENEMGWNTPMEELTNFKQKNVPMHVETPK
jgi:hypothetical protein